ncbi:MAG: class I tRNA ligase family protein, partial [Phycisphaerae bacterium]|nr:class I tRNA ligase family protein [Phycisphaerae bacterium]
ADFSHTAFIERVNSELANNLGNLVHRTVSMIEKYRGGQVPSGGESADVDGELIDVAEGLRARVDEAIDTVRFSEAIQAVMEANRYVEKTKPFVLARDESASSRLDAVLANLHEASRLACVYLLPFMPTKAAEALAALGRPEDADASLAEVGRWLAPQPGVTVRKGEPLFLRIDS